MGSEVKKIERKKNLNLCTFKERHAPILTWFASELELLWEVDIADAVRGCWRAEKEDGDG